MHRTVFPIARMAQTPIVSSPDDMQVVYWIVVGTALLFVITILVLIARKFLGKRGDSLDSIGFDAEFIDRAEDKGGLTKDELRRVREVMVRRALESQDKPKGPTVKDLQAQLISGALRPERPEPNVRPSLNAPLRPERSIPRVAMLETAAPPKIETVKKPEPPPPTQGEADTIRGTTPVDLKMLLDRGLINQEEFDRLTALSREARNDNQSAGS